MPIGKPEPDPFAYPSPAETLGAAFRQHNFIVYLLDAINAPQPDMKGVPGYNPIPSVRGTKYEPFADQFLSDRNPAQVAARKVKIDRDQADQDILAQAGWGGTFDSLVATAANPLWLVLIVYWAYRRAKRAQRGFGLR